MSYILNMLICVGIILLDNLLQCLLFIAMIDLSRTCDSTASLIFYARERAPMVLGNSVVIVKERSLSMAHRQGED
jgi:hypothetical protein